MKNILSLCDAYKISHKFQYPKNTTFVYSNWTPRGTRIPRATKYVFYGLQYFIKEYLIRRFNEEFFKLPKEKALKSFKRRINNYLGLTDLNHFDALYDLGYLPIKIKALPEGSKIGLRVPCLTICNTKPEFYWVTNYLETILSCTLWGAINSATIADLFAGIRDKYLDLTCIDQSMKDWLIHDFSYRGLFGNEGAMISGSAFLLSSKGSDTISAVDFLEEYYEADSDKELVAGSIPAFEHSTVCAGGKEQEEETLVRALTEIYPNGLFAFVADTWDYYNLIGVIAPKHKKLILERNGKIVFRPDSSKKTPLEIICGDKTLEDKNSMEYKGSLEVLWENFGGTINNKGYKILHPSIGLIYGEAIQLDLYENILKTMMEMGFASSNLVVGIGSMSFQYQTRDSLMQAVKATYVEVEVWEWYNNVQNTGWEEISPSDMDAIIAHGLKPAPEFRKIIKGREIFKDPITDDGIKKSAKGLLQVVGYENEGGKWPSYELHLHDQVSKEDEARGLLETVFLDGQLTKFQTLSEIRERLKNQ